MDITMMCVRLVSCGTLIGMDDQRGGFYYFKGRSVEANQVNTVSTSSLWHKGLGHPSHEVLSLLPSSLRPICDGNKDDVCKTCFMQSKLIIVVPISSNKAK